MHVTVSNAVANQMGVKQVTIFVATLNQQVARSIGKVIQQDSFVRRSQLACYIGLVENGLTP
jgi:hypothetical protein